MHDCKLNAHCIQAVMFVSDWFCDLLFALLLQVRFHKIIKSDVLKVTHWMIVVSPHLESICRLKFSDMEGVDLLFDENAIVLVWNIICHLALGIVDFIQRFFAVLMFWLLHWLLWQVKTNFRTAITVPEKSWARFRDIFADYCEKMKEGGEKVSVGGGSDGGPSAKWGLANH
jgi:hypothetical protein